MRSRTPLLLLPLLAGFPLAAQETKVESQLLLAAEPGQQYELSPKGLHVAAVSLRGSRQVLVYDGTDGARYDQILPLMYRGNSGGKVAFSDDGARYAYHAKLGQEYVVVVDGKEVSRGPWAAELATQGRTPVFELGFSPGGKHWYAIIETTTPGRTNYRMILDGVPGPLSQETIAPLWSPDGERHTYIQKINTETTPQPRFVLIVDGKPAPYLAGDMQWTGDSKHLFTQRPIPGTGNVEVLADGQPIMRVPSAVQFTMAPLGPAVLGVARTPFQNGSSSAFLLIGNRKAVGSECANAAGLDAIYISADAKHYAARCAMTFMYIDGKKGQEYPEGISHLLWTDDGRPVYYGRTNQRAFMIIGEQESNAYATILDIPAITRAEQKTMNFRVRPAVVVGNHVAYVARTNPQDGTASVVVVDGKSYPAVMASQVSLSPDGSRFAFVSGRPAQSVTVDGTAYAGAAVDPQLGNVGYQGTIQWSPDSKHVAWVGVTPTGRGILLDGRFIPIDQFGVRFLKFTGNSKHILWLARGPGLTHLVFVDGVKVLDLPGNLPLENEADVYWSFAPDGGISFVAQDNEGMKRFKITPGATSVESAAAKGKPLP